MKSIVEVITEASTYDLTTVDKVLAELRLITSSVIDRQLIQDQITGWSTVAAHYCNRVFPEEAVIETFWPDPTALNQRGGSLWPREFWGWNYSMAGRNERLRLERYPVSSITSIQIDDDPPLVASDFRLDAKKGLVYRLDFSGYPWSWLFAKRVIVSYTGGYATIPADLERAVRLAAIDAWSGASKDPRVKSESAFEVASVSYLVGGGGAASAGDLPSGVEGILWPYRRHPIA